MKLSVVIPVYNEVENIGEILKRVQSTGLANEIIIVDDGSQDGTRDTLKNLNGKENVRVILHERMLTWNMIRVTTPFCCSPSRKGLQMSSMAQGFSAHPIV
jgi:cellulose synthase/poly-beta-1,6-N-acetylglucosamine synthase-like glycosyltransferase